MGKLSGVLGGGGGLKNLAGETITIEGFDSEEYDNGREGRRDPRLERRREEGQPPDDVRRRDPAAIRPQGRRTVAGNGSRRREALK
jgi:hypothetical protein